MRRVELKRYRSILNTQLSVLIGHGDSSLQHLRADEAEEQADPVDRGALEGERGQELRLRDRDRKLIDKIQHALRRLEEGRFDVCESCGGRIAPARLKARPVTTLCIDCKTDAEKRER